MEVKAHRKVRYSVQKRYSRERYGEKKDPTAEGPLKSNKLTKGAWLNLSL